MRTWLLVCWLIGSASLASAAPPNVVFIIADDLGVNDLRCYGRADHATPRLDALAEQGARFTAAYCAQPICSASRAALMTGKSPAELHLTTYLPGRPDASSQLLLHPSIERQLPLAEATIAETLHAQGYATACVGKWHLGDAGFSPLEQGFDVYFPGRAKTAPSELEGGKGEFELTEQAIDFLRTHQARPFFLYLSHNNPHIPLAGQAARVERFADAYNPTYAAMIETLDECVGKVIDELDALGLAERTLVVFTSDNGGLHVPEGELTPATHNTPFRAGKGYLYEGGLRIPLIVRWPGVVPERHVVHAPVINSEWPATLASVADEADADSQGGGLESLLRGDAVAESRTFFWHFPHYTNQGGRPGGAIREGNWKLIEHYEDGRCELFDLETDAAEARDQGALHPERVAVLRGKLEAWRRASAVQLNTTNPGFSQARWSGIYGAFDTTVPKPARTFKETRERWMTWRRRMNAATGQEPHADAGGAVILHAKDAIAHGEKLRYEPEPHKDTLGYWINQDDWAEWDFTAPAAGKYALEVLQGCGAGSGGAVVMIRCGQQEVTFLVEETGHFQRFVPREIGSLTLPAGRPLKLEVRPLKKPGAAVMDLRRITLRGAGAEG